MYSPIEDNCRITGAGIFNWWAVWRRPPVTPSRGPGAAPITTLSWASSLHIATLKRPPQVLAMLSEAEWLNGIPAALAHAIQIV